MIGVLLARKLICFCCFSLQGSLEFPINITVLLGLSHGAWGKVLFVPGQEYTYVYDTLVTTGTEEPTGYASAYKLHGRLRVQAEDENNLAVKVNTDSN